MLLWCYEQHNWGIVLDYKIECVSKCDVIFGSQGSHWERRGHQLWNREGKKDLQGVGWDRRRVGGGGVGSAQGVEGHFCEGKRGAGLGSWAVRLEADSASSASLTERSRARTVYGGVPDWAATSRSL